MAKSVMAHQFSRVPDVRIPRSSFNRSHGYKTTFDSGLLVPILVDEALPGDTFNVNLTAFARLATPIHPVMDNMFMSTFFFAVPKRLVWDNWKRFNGEQDNPADTISYTIPQTAPSSGIATGDIADYFGLPILVSPLTFSALPFRALHLIWNEWFRDENLQDSLTVLKDDGPDPYSTYNQPPPRRAKRHDYFTSALPWTQKGGVDVTLGLTGNASVIGDGGQTYAFPSGAAGETDRLVINATTDAVELGGNPTTSADLKWSTTQIGLVADLSTATAATINDIREAFQIQKLLERDARGGTRYTEIVRSHFGVVSPDARLQRSEYLGGGTQRVNITPVPQTSETATSPQGNLSGFGTVGLNGHGFTKSFTEHSIIIGLVNVHADLTYYQGIDRMWSRTTRYDFYWPSFAHLGEQPIYSKEIYADGTGGDENVFGYQERYAEYRYANSKITGLFRPSATSSLDNWHLAQEFSTRPTLNSTFIEENPPVDRVIAVPTEPHFLFDGYFSMRCVRPMPLYGVPGMVDHF